MVLSITDADIARGIPGDCLRDPVSIALFRITGVQWRVEGDICYPDSGHRYKPFITPKPIKRFIEDFDNGKPVTPLNVKLS